MTSLDDFADASVIPRIRAGGYEFGVRQEGFEGFEEAIYTVNGAIGGGHMIGGGTQGFLGRLPDGPERGSYRTEYSTLQVNCESCHGPVRTHVEMATNPDRHLRALSLASLHWVQGDDPVVRAALVAALTSAESDEALRGRWMLALGFMGDRHRDRGEVDRAIVAYGKALELRPNDPRVLGARAQLYSTAGDFAGAIRDLQQSLAQKPDQPLAWVNLGIARAASGDVLGARDAYREALQLNASEALAHFNLGNTYRQAEDLERALDSYLRAVAADPGLGVAHFEISRLYILLDRLPEALPFARRAVEFRPEHGGSRDMLRDIEQAVGR